MRILQLSSAKALGGGERHLVELSSGLKDMGHEVLLVLRPNSPLIELMPNTTYYELPLRGAVDIFSAVRLVEIIEKNKIDILHVHYARDYPLAAISVYLSRRKQSSLVFFLTRHHYLPIKSNFLYRKLLSTLDCAIAVSENVRQTLTSAFGWPHKPQSFPSPFIEIVPNWIESTEFLLSDAIRKELRSQYGWKEGCTVVGVVNQISPGKGQKVLIEALSLLKDRWLDLHVVFAGQEHGGSSYTSYLRSLIAEAGLSDRVEFLGYVKNIAELYNAVDIVAIPSENEAFSIVCLEAMASGRAVIASNVGGLAEIIEDGKTGVLFSVGDSKELAEKLDLLLSQPAFADRLVAAARKIIEERFLRRRQIARTEQLYREAIERRCR